MKTATLSRRCAEHRCGDLIVEATTVVQPNPDADAGRIVGECIECPCILFNMDRVIRRRVHGQLAFEVST